MDQGDWVTAEQLLAQAVVSCPINTRSRRLYADALHRRGNLPEALVQLNEARELSPNDASLSVRAANIHLQQGQLEQAQKAASAALNADPNSADAWQVRGRVRLAQGQHRDALADLQRALGLRPDDRRLLSDMATAYQRIGSHRRALATVQSLIDTYPEGEEPAEVCFREGEILAALGRSAAAAEAMQLACRRGQPTTRMLQQLAETELRAGHPQEADQVLRHLLAHHPSYPPAVKLYQQLADSQGPNPIR